MHKSTLILVDGVPDTRCRSSLAQSGMKGASTHSDQHRIGCNYSSKVNLRYHSPYDFPLTRFVSHPDNRPKAALGEVFQQARRINPREPFYEIFGQSGHEADILTDTLAADTEMFCRMGIRLDRRKAEVIEVLVCLQNRILSGATIQISLPVSLRGRLDMPQSFWFSSEAKYLVLCITSCEIRDYVTCRINCFAALCVTTGEHSSD